MFRAKNIKMTITPQLSFSYIFMIFFNYGKNFFFSSFFFFFVFLPFFLFFLFFFFFFILFFLFSFLSFLFLVFLSYFLLKSSNTPLLFPNFHFHRNITLPKKKKREREALFSNWTSYIFLNLGFLFLFLNILFQRV